VKGFAVLLSIGLALIGTGCFGDDDEEATPGRAQPELADTTVVEGGPARERALMRRVMQGMQMTTLTRIAIGQRQGRRETDAGGRAVPVSFTSVPGPSVRGQWDEWIVAGAFSRRLQRAGLSAEVDASGRGGSFTARPKLPGQPDPQPLSRQQQARVVRGIRNAARQSGAAVARLDVHRPYGTAVVLTLAPEDPALFLKEELRPLLERLDVHRVRLEGLYLAVLDESRRLAVEWGSWTRNPAGSYWVRHDLTNCSPIRQTEPPGAEPPPECPA
jgi:hypothetical protein